MLTVCGSNNCNHIDERSNTETSLGQSICPPIQSSIDASTISSFSSFEYHSVLVLKNGVIQAAGNNQEGQIFVSLPRKKIEKFTEFKIIDRDGSSLYPISAACGYDFTLYLVSSTKNSEKKFLIYTFKGIKTDFPLFLKIDSNPVSLFVGSYNAAAVDDKGSVLFIPMWLKNSPETEIEASTLPGDEKAICVACCIDAVFVVSENGKLFVSKIDELKEKNQTKLNFTQIDLLKGEKIISVSGTYNHCFAVSEKGKVFGCGSNEFSKLGFKKDIEKVEEFTRIQSLGKFKIKSAYAGLCHSLFITQKNGLLALGDAQFGQLFTDSLINEPFSEPIETEIKNATFCIAGDSFSCVFSDCEPINSPNRCINFEKHVNIETLQNEINVFESLLSLNSQPENCTKFTDYEEENEFFTNPELIGEGKTSFTYKVFDKNNDSNV